MAALTDRKAARRQILATVEKALDQVIPLDENTPLRGRTFLEWEQQADAFDRAVTTTLLEQRALLEDSAQLEAGELGSCPRCRSDRLYLQRDVTHKSPDPFGPLWRRTRVRRRLGTSVHSLRGPRSATDRPARNAVGQQISHNPAVPAAPGLLVRP